MREFECVVSLFVKGIRRAVSRLHASAGAAGDTNTKVVKGTSKKVLAECRWVHMISTTTSPMLRVSPQNADLRGNTDYGAGPHGRTWEII